MLLYRTLVTDALINEMEPLLRKLIQDAMMQGQDPTGIRHTVRRF